MILSKGWVGEKKTTFKLWLFLSSKTYYRFHNLIIPSKNGTAQIDHLLISPYGLFIIETKNRDGWIFGTATQSQWTQTFYKSKYKFQNPLRQIYRQKKVLSEFLDIEESLIHTVIYFAGNCEIKTDVPPNVLNRRLAKYIKSFKSVILFNEEVERIFQTIKRHKSESKLTDKHHIYSLIVRHGSDTHCPRCGSRLVERTIKRGEYAGSMFLGCSSYPSCRFKRDM